MEMVEAVVKKRDDSVRLTVDRSTASGLISLKGGDLKQEINECNCKPAITEIEKLFPLEYFHEKYLLHILPGK